VLALTRQNVPQLRLGLDADNRCAGGAYELIAAEGGAATVSLFASGSEVAAITGNAAVNVAVEAGIRQGWDAIIGSDGTFVGMTGFGASGPYKELYQHFGITPQAVAEAALARLGKS
jgi:transketolase